MQRYRGSPLDVSDAIGLTHIDSELWASVIESDVLDIAFKHTFSLGKFYNMHDYGEGYWLLPTGDGRSPTGARVSFPKHSAEERAAHLAAL